MNTVETKERIELEYSIVRRLIRSLKEAGWNLLEVDDGGEEPVKVNTEDEAIEAVFAVHEAYLFFTKPREGNSTRMMEHWVRFIPGNGEDIISDFNYSEKPGDDFLDVINHFESNITDTNDGL